MLYQKLLMGRDAYFVSVAEACEFEMHRHPEFELSYCIEGSYYIIIDYEEYLMTPGKVAFVKPMAAHDIKYNGGGKMLTVVIGPGLLGDSFDDFVNRDFDVVINGKCDKTINCELVRMLDESVYHHLNISDISELVIKGNLFHISRMLLQYFSKGNCRKENLNDIQDVKKIEKAIQIIYEEYPSKLDVDSVAGRCGYSKSHFCRVFKRITGETFHSLLNKQRVEIACMHLSESKISIDEVSVAVGFGDTQSFCRVFRQIMGVSAGKYRKEKGRMEIK